MDTELIPKHNNPIGTLVCPIRTTTGDFQGGSTAVFPPLKNRPETQHKKSAVRPLRLLRLDWADFFDDRKPNMPRMSKKRKLELSFFLNERGRVAHNILCRKCRHACKQSFRVLL